MFNTESIEFMKLDLIGKKILTMEMEQVSNHDIALYIDDVIIKSDENLDNEYFKTLFTLQEKYINKHLSFKKKKIESTLDFLYEMVRLTSELKIQHQVEYWTNEYNSLYKEYEKLLIMGDFKNENNENGKTDSMDWI